MLWKIATAGHDSAITFAAEELGRCLKSMDDAAEIAILRYAAYRPSVTNVLWLGIFPEVACEVIDPEFDDAYRIDVENGSGSIRGSNSRSVLFGVYRFLRELGCSWVRPGADGEYLPSRSLTGIDVHIHDKASYRHRGICIEGAVSYEHVRNTIDWMPKLGYNAYFNQYSNPVLFYRRWYEHHKNPLYEPETLTREEVEGLRDSSVAELKKRGLLYHAAGHGWTCEPFGIFDGTRGADVKAPEHIRKYLAKLNGKREYWKGNPIDTNLCYSNPGVRKLIAKTVAERCAENPEIDFMHVWLADGYNNACECDKCISMMPADWYVMLQNEIDEHLNKRGLKTKIVFLIYHELYWEPTKVEFRNPDRFVMMFAPITRTYTTSIADAEEYDDAKLPAYIRNDINFPRSVEENIGYLRRWEKHFSGDGFDFDYHYMWDHFFDPGYYQMARILFSDMQALHSIGLNGMVSCQNHRVFLPHGLGMTAMAEALWNEHADFEEVAKRFFYDAFREDGAAVETFMKALSEAFDPPYIRGEKPAVSKESAERFAQVPKIVQEFMPLVRSRCQADLPAAVHRSWEYLTLHGELCILLAKAFQRKAEGKFNEAELLKNDVYAYARLNEEKLHNVLDVHGLQSSIDMVFRRGIPET